jgi:hypothetical protein
MAHGYNGILALSDRFLYIGQLGPETLPSIPARGYLWKVIWRKELPVVENALHGSLILLTTSRPLGIYC